METELELELELLLELELEEYKKRTFIHMCPAVGRKCVVYECHVSASQLASVGPDL